jgi:hypothetical protein
MQDSRWTRDIHGTASMQVLFQYLVLWDTLSDITLHQGVQDTYIWRFSAAGQYSAKSAYDALCQGATHFAPWKKIWSARKVSLLLLASSPLSMLDS